MQMPNPDDHHEKLHALVGNWDGQEKMFPSPWDSEGGESVGQLTAKMELHGFFLFSNYEQIRDGHVTFKGHGVYGYDAHAGKYTMHWFDTMGGDPGAPAMGDWEGDTLTFTNQHYFGYGRYTYQFINKGEYTFKMESSQDGENWNPLMESTFRRK